MIIKIYIGIILLFSIGCGERNQNNIDNQLLKENLVTKQLKNEILINSNSPVIDGQINEKEWGNSKKYKLFGGDSIYLLNNPDTIFIAVRGNSGGFTSLGIGNMSKIKILHSSTGLITAEYKKVNGKWELSSDFKEPLTENGQSYPRDGERLTYDYKKSQIEQFGWYANLVEMGVPSETELMIPKSILPTGELFFSLVFYQFKSTVHKAKFPYNLSDDMLNQSLISGSANDELIFNVESWKLLSDVLEK